MPAKRTRAVSKAPTKRIATAARARRVPLLRASDVRMIVLDLSSRMAPGDVADLLQLDDRLRVRAARLKAPQLALLRSQLEFALDCLRDHLSGQCPQIPYSTISLLTAAVCYFADEIDVIPDFLPRIGKLDDAAVMAMAFELGEDGIRRYCTWKGRSTVPLFGARRAVRERRC
jgi:uncharacterized membrane protein YkvA (DUF1232 family)